MQFAECITPRVQRIRNSLRSDNHKSTFELQPHPDIPTPFVEQLRVCVEPQADGCMRFRFEVLGDLSKLEVPAVSAAKRTDGLWRATCFEVFLRGADATGYEEWNFAPSGEWAAYRFDAYREGMSPLELAHEPTMRWRADARRGELDVLITRAAPSVSLHMGLSAVLRDAVGRSITGPCSIPRASPTFITPQGLPEGSMETSTDEVLRFAANR